MSGAMKDKGRQQVPFQAGPSVGRRNGQERRGIWAGGRLAVQKDGRARLSRSGETKGEAKGDPAPCPASFPPAPSTNSPAAKSLRSGPLRPQLLPAPTQEAAPLFPLLSSPLLRPAPLLLSSSRLLPSGPWCPAGHEAASLGVATVGERESACLLWAASSTPMTLLKSSMPIPDVNTEARPSVCSPRLG